MLPRTLMILMIAACGNGTPMTERPRTFGGDRPVSLEVPSGFDETKQYPLVIVLHGYSVSGFVQEAYFGLKALQTGARRLSSRQMAWSTRRAISSGTPIRPVAISAASTRMTPGTSAV